MESEMVAAPDTDLLAAVAAVLPLPIGYAEDALAAAGRVLGERLRAASEVYGQPTPAWTTAVDAGFARGMHTAYVGAAVAVESACGVPGREEGE